MNIVFSSLLNVMWEVKLFSRIFLFFDSIIYGIAGNTYNLFNTAVGLNAYNSESGAALVSAIPQIVSRLKTIFIVFMLFRLAFTLLTYLADPDKFSDSKTGPSKIVVNIAVSIAMLIASPYVFDLINRFQDATLGANETMGNNVVANLVLGDDGHIIVGDNAGPKFVNKIFMLFCNIRGNNIAESTTYTPETFRSWFKAFDAKSVTDAFSAVYSGAPLYTISPFVYATRVYYWPIVSGIAGIFLVYFFFSFAIDVIIRLLKLKILEVISPIPILMYMDNNGQKYLQNFVKLYAATFLSFYAKLAAVFLAIVLAQGVTNWAGTTESDIWLKVVIIFGIFYFTKELPKMFSDLFGINFGDGKLKGKGFLNALAGAGILAAAGGIKAATTGMGIGGILAAAGTGAVRGGRAGATSDNVGAFVRNGLQANERNFSAVNNARAAGGYGAVIRHGVDNVTGANRRLERDQAAVKNYRDKATTAGNSINDGLSHQMVTDEYGNSVQLGDEQTFTNRRIQNDNQYNLAKGMYDTATTDSDRAAAAALMNERMAQIQSRAHSEYGKLAQDYASQVVDNNGNSVESGSISLSYAQSYDSSASSTLSSSNAIGTRDTAAGRAIEDLNAASRSTEFIEAANHASARAGGTTPADFSPTVITATTTGIMDVVGDKNGHVANLERNMSQTRQAQYRGNSGGNGH